MEMENTLTLIQLMKLNKGLQKKNIINNKENIEKV